MNPDHDDSALILLLRAALLFLGISCISVLLPAQSTPNQAGSLVPVENPTGDARPAPLPPHAPIITFQDGKLTIVAENSSLDDTLQAISERTGAVLELHVANLQERIFAHLGPGPARDVVAELLDGSSLNYVLQSPDADPSGLQLLAISSRSGSQQHPAEVAESAVAQSAAPTLYGAGFTADPSEVESAETHVEVPGRTASALSPEILDKLQKLQLQQLDNQSQQQQEQSTAPQQ